MRILFLILFVLCQSGFSFAESKIQPQSHTPSSHSERQQEQRGTEKNPLFVKGIPVEKTKEEAQEDKRERAEKASSDWWLVELTGVLALATIALVCVTGGLVFLGFRQMRDMRESVNAAKRSAQAAESAAIAATQQVEMSRQSLVSLERAFVYKTDNVCLSHRDPETNEVWWSFDVVWRNSGNTPTRNLEVRAYRYLEDTNLPEDFAFEPADRSAQKTFLAPKGRIQSTRITASGNELRDVINGRKFFYIWGWAEYNDVFDGTDRHVTRFCDLITILGDPELEWHEDNRVEFTSHHHPRFNCTDEECEDQDRNPIKATIEWVPASPRST